MSDTAQNLAEMLSPADPAIRLSVIIVNWNTKELLRACLASLQSYIENPAAEIMVVDNASSDGSAEMVSADFPRVRLFQLPSNIGFSRGNNVALRQAVGQYLLLLNSDTEVRGNALWDMCDRMDACPAIGAIGAKLLNPDGTVQLSCRSFPSYQTALFHRKSLLTRLFPGNRFSQKYLMTNNSHAEPMEVDWVIGACLMTRRETVHEIGLLDESFFMYSEDVDWCYRMRKAGWTVEYLPTAEVMHHYEKSAGLVPFKMNKARHRSMWLFYKKHYSNGNPIKDVVTAFGIMARFLLITVQNLLKSR